MEQSWNVMCNVDKVIIDIKNRRGVLLLPANNYPDMHSTIKCFTSVDPECQGIFTYVDRQPNTVYLLTDDGWKAYKNEGAPFSGYEDEFGEVL